METHKGMQNALLRTMWHMLVFSPAQPGVAHESGLQVFIPAPMPMVRPRKAFQ